MASLYGKKTSGALGGRRRGFLRALARHLAPIKAIGLFQLRCAGENASVTFGNIPVRALGLTRSRALTIAPPASNAAGDRTVPFAVLDRTICLEDRISRCRGNAN